MITDADRILYYECLECGYIGYKYGWVSYCKECSSQDLFIEFISIEE